MVLVPGSLIFLTWLLGGGYDLYQDSQHIDRELTYAESQLERLQALTVAAKIDQGKYSDLVEQFAANSGLHQSLQSTSTEEVATRLAALVSAIEQGIRSAPYFAEAKTRLSFESVSPGERGSFSPFTFVEFEINLEGRFFAIPKLLDLLTRISLQQKCKVSVGTLQVQSLDPTGRSGELSIVLPIRAYFLEP